MGNFKLSKRKKNLLLFFLSGFSVNYFYWFILLKNRVLSYIYIYIYKDFKKLYINMTFVLKLKEDKWKKKCVYNMWIILLALSKFYNQNILYLKRNYGEES